MGGTDADRNLLFGVLALQLDFIAREQLIAAVSAWVLDKGRPLEEILVAQGALSPERRAMLGALVAEHLRAHGDDPARSLAALSSISSAREELSRIADPDLDASLGHLGVDPHATRMPSVGAPTSSGARFRVLRFHARGGLGTVHVARDEELGREVALKEIQDLHADDPRSRARFVREAEVTGGLEHPGIVPVYGLGRYEDGRPYYAMRFIRGDSLQEAIARFHRKEERDPDPGARSLEFRRLLGRLVDVCEAIAYAHARGVLHRDLKPGNVMLGKFGETLVVDWGLAKPVDAPESAGSEEGRLVPPSGSGSEATLPGTAVGTPAYMSPEQAAGRLDRLGPASDVYSLGATLYSLLTGHAPVEDHDKGEVLRRVERGEFPRPRALDRSIPAALEAVCLRAMARDPADRYASARGLADDLEHWLADEPVAAYREPLPARARRWARRHRTTVATAAAAALVAVAIGGGAWWWAEHRERGRQLRLAGEVQTKLDEANGRAGRARQSGDLGRWSEAVASAEGAWGLAESGGLRDAGLRGRVAAAVTELRRGRSEATAAAEATARDRRLLAALDEARLASSAGKDGHFDVEAEVDAYRRAFREAGIDVAALDRAAAVARLGALPSRVDQAAALDDWAEYAKDPRLKSHLRSLAHALDPDPLRDGVRAAIARRDRPALLRLAAETHLESLPPATLVRLGNALDTLGESGRAASLLEEAQRLHPGDFWINEELYLALSEVEPPQTERAARHAAIAVALRPSSPAAHSNLGIALRARGDLAGSEAAYREAIRLRPDLAEAHNNLGNALRDRGDAAGAAAAFREAIRLRPADAEAHAGLGFLLKQFGRFAESLAEFEKAHELGSKRPGWRYPSGQWVRDARRLVALEASLPSVLRGERQPTDADERVILAQVCYARKLHVAAVRLSDEALKMSPELARPQLGHRYNAACSAALAGSGESKDEPPPDESTRRRLRRQALDWLRADLDSWAASIARTNKQGRAIVRQKLRHWQEDADLAGLRDEPALARLDGDERAACRSLWARVAAVLQDASFPADPFHSS